MTDEWKDAMHLFDIAATTEHEDVRKAALDMIHNLAKPVLQALADGRTAEPAGPLGVVWGNPFTDVVKRAEQKAHDPVSNRWVEAQVAELRKALRVGDDNAIHAVEALLSPHGITVRYAPGEVVTWFREP